MLLNDIDLAREFAYRKAKASCRPFLQRIFHRHHKAECLKNHLENNTNPHDTESKPIRNHHWSSHNQNNSMFPRHRHSNMNHQRYYRYPNRLDTGQHYNVDYPCPSLPHQQIERRYFRFSTRVSIGIPTLKKYRSRICRSNHFPSKLLFQDHLQ